MTATVATVAAAARAVLTSTAATPTAAAAAAAAIFPGNGQHEVWEASRRGASQAARLQGNASNTAHADARDGPGRDSEMLSAWARIPECVPRRDLGREIHI